MSIPLSDILADYNPGLVRRAHSQKNPAIIEAETIVKKSPQAQTVSNHSEPAPSAQPASLDNKTLFQLAENFLETNAVKAGSESERIWLKIVEEYLVDGASTDKPAEAKRISTALRELADNGQLTLDNFRKFKDNDCSAQSLSLPLHPVKALKAIVRIYDRQLPSYRSRSKYIQQAAATIEKLNDTETTHLEKTKLLVTDFFHPEPVKKFSNSYQAWTKMVAVLYYKKTPKDSLDQDTTQKINTSYQNIRDLRRYGSPPQAKEDNCIHYITDSNKVVPAELTQNKNRRGCGSFFYSCFQSSKPAITPVTLQEITQAHPELTSMPDLAFSTYLGRGLTQTLKGSNNPNPNFINLYIAKNRLEDIPEFSNPAIFLERLSHTFTSCKNDTEAAFKLRQILKDINDFTKLPPNIRKFLFLKGTEYLNPNEMLPYLKKLILSNSPTTDIVHFVSLEAKEIIGDEATNQPFLTKPDREKIALNLQKKGLITDRYHFFNMVFFLQDNLNASTLNALVTDANIALYLKGVTPLQLEQDPKALKEAYINALKIEIDFLPLAVKERFYRYFDRLGQEKTNIPAIDTIREIPKKSGIYGSTDLWKQFKASMHPLDIFKNATDQEDLKTIFQTVNEQDKAFLRSYLENLDTKKTGIKAIDDLRKTGRSFFSSPEYPGTPGWKTFLEEIKGINASDASTTTHSLNRR